MANSISLPDNRRTYAGCIGNGQTCALIDARGRIGWMCLPTFAQFPIFASLLDPQRGGYCELGLVTERGVFWSGQSGDVHHRYLPGANILETSWALPDGHVTIKDRMPLGHAQLIRDIQLDRVNPGARLAVRIRPTAPVPEDTQFLITEDRIIFKDRRCVAEGLLVCSSPNAARAVLYHTPNEIVYEFVPRANRLTLVFDYASPIQFSGDSDEQWLSRRVRLDLPDRSLHRVFERSLLTLRCLTYEPTGAILAAATASFPSEPGGQHNWDYRYCWVRDGCYAARALNLAGCRREADRLYRFLLDREANGQWRRPLWAIEPDYPTAEKEIRGLHGPAGETPIRIGNNAAFQDQHDSPGNVIAGVYEHCVATGETALAVDYWQAIARAADWCCENWAELEAGIWEKRDRHRAWVHGRAMCWVALRDAIRLAGWVNRSAPARWQSAQNEIANTLRDRPWSEARGAFLSACGEPSGYDTSVLTLLLEDLIQPDDARIRRTVATLEQQLAYRGGFRRDEESVRPPFYLSTLWMIRALQRIGEYDRAFAYLGSVIAGATNLDLMAEYFDPLSSQQYGNFPHAFSHSGFVRAVCEMLWRLDDRRIILFPAIPSHWLVPGNVLNLSNVPLDGHRAILRLCVTNDVLDFATSNTGDFQIMIPPRYFNMGKRVRLNSTWQN